MVQNLKIYNYYKVNFESTLKRLLSFLYSSLGAEGFVTCFDVQTFRK